MQSASSDAIFPSVGSLVHVQSRTWANINKPGGVGRVTKIYLEDGDRSVPTHVDVKYIVNSGTESRVEIIFVEAHSFEDRRRSTNIRNSQGEIRIRGRANNQNNDTSSHRNIPSSDKKRSADTSSDIKKILVTDEKNLEINHRPFDDEPTTTALVTEDTIKDDIMYHRLDEFIPLLNKIRMEDSLDAIHLSHLLSQINQGVHNNNNNNVEPNFTSDELKSYLIILEKDNRIMVTWDDSMIYWI